MAVAREHTVEEILCRFPRGKVQEALEKLSVWFGVPLVMLDPEGATVASAGAEGVDAEVLAAVSSHNGREVAVEPLHLLGHRVGSLAVWLPPGGTRRFSRGIIRSLEELLKLEGEMDDLSSEIVRIYEELSLISSISAKLGGEMELSAICRLILEEADKILSVRTLFVMLIDREHRELATRLATGRDRAAAYGFRADASAGLVGHVFQQGEPVTICDIAVDGRLSLPYRAKTVLCVPLISDRKPVGMMIATDKLSGEEFWSQELKLMGIFASEVASAIRKARLYEEINKLFLSTVEALTTAIDAKDPYTYGHSRRVARISVAICAELGMSKERIRKVELASFLHDIGKIGTPEGILRKPGILRPDEFEKIKEHPAKGAEILSMIYEFREIITWIRHHHEWYDGKGYPDCIAAEAIPIEARVITISDAYDAMTSDRPYRKGMPSSEVMKIMRQFTRSQFDPYVLEAFQRVISKGGDDFQEQMTDRDAD